MPTYAEWVSTAAFGLAAVSLAWQIARARRDQPRAALDGAWSLAPGRDDYGDPTSEPGAWVFDVNMSNVGDRALTVTEVHWELEIPSGGVQKITSRVRGGPIPRRLDAHDHETWQIGQDLDGTSWHGRRARPAATIIRRHGLIQRWLGAKPETPISGQWVMLRDPRQADQSDEDR